MKILVAEDDSVSRRMLEAFLSKCRYEVAVTTDGAQAWKILERNDALRTPAGEIGVTLSLGVAASKGEIGPSEDMLIHAADVVLYRAKQLGRNRVETACVSDYGEAEDLH